MPDVDGGTPLVSVVLPVHNGAHHLAECLDSVLAQSLRAIEVIVVDDGSTDATPELLNAYAAADDRVRVVSQRPNRGVSAARNAGLNLARGRFVAFVDADDFVDRSMLEDLFTASQELRVDVVSCGMTLVDENGRFLGTVDFPLAAGVRHGPERMREVLHSAFSEKLLWYPFRSLYAHHLIDDYGLRFDGDIRKGEDSLFNLQALLFADGVASVPGAPYHYRKHPGSATARALVSESANLERLGRQVRAFYDAHGFDARAHADFLTHVVRSDLPTSLVRLGASAGNRRQVRDLLHTTTVRDAFAAVPLRRLEAPLRVRALLVLARMRAVGPLLVALRVSRFMRRR